MDRREFLKITTTSLAMLGLGGVSSFEAGAKAKGGSYSMVILGDTHFDTEPADVYHSLYNEPIEWLNRVQRQEFARNGEMWRERCPRLLKRAACLVDDDTRMVLQMGDLIQGDCGSAEVHNKMLCDVMDSFKAELSGLPFVTVVGNHDIRGNYDATGAYDHHGDGAERAYHAFMPGRMSQELGTNIEKTTFHFLVGPDVFIVVDFNSPDTDELERILAATEDARNTFVISHGPVFPYDAANCRWFLLGSAKRTEQRRHFRELFARRDAIVLCGHAHTTELLDWYGDGGRITQMTMNSVWSKEEYGTYTVNSEGAGDYGELRKRLAAMPNGKPIADESALFDEYRPGIKRYVHSPSAGSYKMTVRGRHVTIDFYSGDSSRRSERFILR